MKSTLFLCGAGNAEGVRLALRVNERKPQWEKIVILDDDPQKKGASILGIEIAGPFDLLKQADPADAEAANLVARTTVKRHAAYQKIKQYGIPFTSLIDASVDTWGVEYRGDVTIYQNVTFSAGASIDQGSVVFTGAVVGHKCKVGKWCVIAPGAVLNARVELEDGVYLGTNASVLPDLKIGAWATVGLNTGIVENVPAGATALGVPAQILLRSGTKADTQPSAGPSQSIAGLNESATEMEKNLTDLWGRLLKVEKVGINDNFFDVGGDSLLAVKLHAELKKTVDQELTLVDLFRFPTIASLVEYITHKNEPVSETFFSGESKHSMLSRRRFAKVQSRGRGNAHDPNIQEVNTQ